MPQLSRPEIFRPFEPVRARDPRLPRGPLGRHGVWYGAGDGFDLVPLLVGKGRTARVAGSAYCSGHRADHQMLVEPGYPLSITSRKPRISGPDHGSGQGS